MIARLSLSPYTSAIPLLFGAGALIALQEARIEVAALLAALIVGVALSRPNGFVLWMIPFLILVPPIVRLPSFGGPDLTPQRVILCVALLGLLANNRLRAQLPNGFIGVASAFLAYVLLDEILHAHPQGLNRTVGYAVEPLLPIFLISSTVDSLHRVRIVLNRFLIALGIASAAAIYEFITRTYIFAADPPFFFHATVRAGEVRAQGVFPHPLVLGVVLAVALPLGVARVLTTQGLEKRIAVLSSLLMAGALVFTFGRGPWLAAAVALGLLAAMLRGSLRVQAVAMVFCVLLAISLSPLGSKSASILKAVVGAQTQANGGYAVAYRSELFRSVSGYVLAHPFGAGPGGSEDIPLYASVGGHDTDLVASVDNAYAKYALDLGWPGLVLVLALLMTLLRYTARLYRASTDPELKPILAALVASQVAMLLVSFTVATFTWAQVLLLFWSLAGLAFAIGRLSGSQKLVVPRPRLASLDHAIQTVRRGVVLHDAAAAGVLLFTLAIGARLACVDDYRRL